MGEGGAPWSSTFLCVCSFTSTCALGLLFSSSSQERAGHRQGFRTVIALKPDIIKISFITITDLRA